MLGGGRLFLMNHTEHIHTYEGVSKSPRTMLITRKSLVVHEFPARVWCGGVLWLSVPSGVVGCGCVWLLHVSLCVYCISRLRFFDIGGMADLANKGCASSSVWVWVKREVKLLKWWNRLLVICAWAVAELLSGFDVSRMAELRLLMMIDQVGQARHGNTPSKLEQVRAAVNQDRRRTIHDLCAEVGIGYGSCQRILAEQLNMHRIAAKFVQTVLTQDQNWRKLW